MTLCRWSGETDTSAPRGDSPRRARPRTAAPWRRLSGRVRPLRRPEPAPARPEPAIPVAAANGTHANRPGPTLRWTDPTRCPRGDFAALGVPNAEVARAELPGPGDTWETVSAFCLSYDGYAYWDDLPELANRALQRWTRDRTTPGRLDEVRACLFYEQRRWHHLGTEPADRGAQYVAALLDAVRVLARPPASPALPADPRPARAPETHVRIVPGPEEPVPVVHAMPEPVRRLAAVAAAEAHIRLVSSVETSAAVVPLPDRRGSAEVAPVVPLEAAAPAELAAAAARHPSARRGPVPAGRAAHPSGGARLPDLRPMPSAEALPKPSVITRRPGHVGNGHDPSGVVRALRRPGPDHDDDGPDLQSPATRHGLTLAPPVFCGDDPGFRAWADAHPHGFVLNARGQRRSPVLHRVGCPSLQRRAGSPGDAGGSASGGHRVCATSAADLEAWCAARGPGAPVACRRCHP